MIQDIDIKIKDVGKFYFFAKRFFDILFSLTAIICLSPLLLLLLFVEIILTRGHPVYFDHRIGQNGNPISVYKFRSMCYDAESNIDKYLSPEQIEAWERERKVDNDPRVTKFGNVLRKTSLDELPQLFNILFGNMSFVGPRPITERELDNFSEEQKKLLLSAKPGLTGYWQVYGRSNVDYESGIRQTLELTYFAKRSLWFDFKLILKTVLVVLKKEGAQ